MRESPIDNSQHYAGFCRDCFQPKLPHVVALMENIIALLHNEVVLIILHNIPPPPTHTYCAHHMIIYLGDEINVHS